VMTHQVSDALFGDPTVGPGSLVGPVRTRFGWHLILVHDRAEPSSGWDG
jgi:hypothetical protein